MFAERQDQIRDAKDVRLKGWQRIAHGLDDRGAGGVMIHDLRSFFFEDGSDAFEVPNIDAMEGGLGIQITAEAGREVVHNGDAMASFHVGVHNMASNKTGPSGHDDLHGVRLG